jgi:hypothetical protein
MRTFFVILALAVMAFGIYGCEDEQDRRDAERTAERAAQEAERAVEQATREAERNLDRELERAEAELDRVREKLDETELSEEEIERIARDVEESVNNGLARLGQVLEDIGTRIQEDADVKVVDFREFRALLPSELMNMERIDWKGSNKSAFSMRFSKLEGHSHPGSGHDERIGRHGIRLHREGNR